MAKNVFTCHHERYGKVNYEERNLFIINSDSESEEIKKFFRLPEDTILEWHPRQCGVLAGAHRHTKKGVEHYALIPHHSKVAWVNYSHYGRAVEGVPKGTLFFL